MTTFSKTTIRQTLREGNIEEAAKQTAEYADRCGLLGIASEIDLILHNLETHKRLWNSGQIAYDAFSHQYARLAQGVMDCLNRLPDTVKFSAATKPKLMTEQAFKNRLLWAVVIAKGLLAGWIYYLYAAGGFTTDQLVGIAVWLLSTLAVLVTAVGTDKIFATEAKTENSRYVAGHWVWAAAWLIPLYVLLFASIPIAKVLGNISFEQMSALLLSVESVLGAYIGKIAINILKKDG